MFDELIEKSESLSLDEFLDFLLERTGYLSSLQLLENGDSKAENVMELRSTIVSYMNESDEPSLNGFLEEIALYTDSDRDTSTDDKVTLMTIHSAKGLEYENIFVAGMEDGIFPGVRSFDSEEDMEEERRLAYVAITRAKKELYLITARQRMLYGQTQHNTVSRFIKEINGELIEKRENAAAVNMKVSGSSVTAVRSATLQQQLARNKSAVSPRKSAPVSFTVGERVLHNIFGEGTVISAQETGGDSLLEIAFEKVGTKKIMANFAKLKKL
jgi:DNA helicase-2/ATP-dependent DNA helicase PcrA